jgi:S-DNA-T family DNA segregation ATPase FtsK/SpoIIIE
MRFPVFALIAPIVTSLVLWLVTKSPYTLLFALMGPVMAVASFLDARAGERRRQRQAHVAAGEERVEAEAAIQSESARDRRDLRHAHPAAAELSTLDPRARPPWNDDFAASATVRLGLRAGSGPAHDLSPLLADAAAGIVCVGNPAFSLSLLRALWMQLSWNVAPATLAVHAVEHIAGGLSAVGTWPILLVESEAHIPPAARYVIEVVSPNEGRLSDRDHPRHGSVAFIPDYFTAIEARSFAQRLEHTSRQIEQAQPDAQLPTDCALGDVLRLRMGANLAEGGGDVSPRETRSSLAAPVGMSSGGVLELDLVVHGPHAVVTGMTGTGKTEFLLSWILSTALCHSPEEFTYLIIDFKGGSGFARIADLPHCMGIVTDLDIAAAQRALHSLRAELRFRERALNSAGVTDIRHIPEGTHLPRLVIVVDEYRALVDRFVELQPLFLDIAARGRALGVHLVLGTQRATGVLADGILANCALRIVFRVNNASDSMALLESDAAHNLPEIPGRAVLRATGLTLTRLQVAQSTAADSVQGGELADRWRAGHPLWQPRRPWLPELPHHLSLQELTLRLDDNGRAAPEDSVLLGLLDEPDDQRQTVANYCPGRDGHLLIQGEQGSGKSTALRLIASQTHRHVSLGVHNPEEAWDSIATVSDDTLVLLDNLEALLAEFTLEHRDVFLEQLLVLLRTGPQRGVFVVVVSQSGSLLTSSWTALMKSTLAFRSPPGRATWGEKALQVALAQAPSVSGSGTWPEGTQPRPPLMRWHPGQSYILVTARPRLRMAEMAEMAEMAKMAEGAEGADEAEAPGGVSPLSLTDIGRLPSDLLQVSSEAVASVFVGDVEDWQSQFALHARLRPHASYIFDDCSPAEVRAVRRSRDVLPHTNRGSAIYLSLEGVATRVTLTLPLAGVPN